MITLQYMEITSSIYLFILGRNKNDTRFNNFSLPLKRIMWLSQACQSLNLDVTLTCMSEDLIEVSRRSLLIGRFFYLVFLS